MIRVLQISGRADIGGGPRAVEQLIDGLSALGVTSSVVCPEQRPYYQRFKRSVGGHRLLSIAERRLTVRDVLRTARLVRRGAIDVIHTHGAAAGALGRLAGLVARVPVVHTFHGFHPDGYSRGRMALERILDRLTAATVCVSHAELSRVVEHLGESTVRTQVANCVPSTEARARHARPIVVAVMCRMEPEKGIEECAAVVRAIGDDPILRDHVVFKIAGDGPELRWLQSSLASLERTGVVTFIGWVHDPAAFMSDCQVYLTCSRAEGLPLAVLEAMSVGLPVVASRIDAHEEMLCESGLGEYLFPLSDPHAAADIIAKLLDETVWQRASDDARDAVLERYGCDRMAIDTAKVYTVACRGRKRARTDAS